MTNEHTEHTELSSNAMNKKYSEWHEKRSQIYNELISMARINDSKLSDCMEDNLEYVMALILKYGTYAENAKAIRMYSEYFNICNLLNFY
jgi:hypothetical protein